MTTHRPDTRLGSDLGPYRIERVIGRGGMGVVYLAEQRELGRKVALKLLPDELAHDADFRARFERESRLAAAIDHPNVIPLYEAGAIEGTLFLAMRYVEGIDLATRLREGPLPTPVAVEILGQVAGALDVAHTRGLVHRDIKPGNVLLDRTGGEEHPHAYLTDFGLTKQAGTDSGLTRAGSFMGTPAYMAPEQVDGTEVDARADQYSLGCVSFEALTGQMPFVREKEVAVALAHLKDPVPSAVALRPELPAPVDVVLAKAMAKDREARYPTCAAFVEDLRAALGGEAITARSVRPDARRPPLLVAAVLGIGLVAVAGLVVALGFDGSGSGGASPSGSVGAVPSPSSVPTASPTPQPTFSGSDNRLIAWMPADLPADCARGTNVLLPTRQGPTLKPLGHIVCEMPGGLGPDVIEGFDPSFPASSTPGDGRKAFRAADVVVGMARERGLSEGACSGAGSAFSVWRPGTGDTVDEWVLCDVVDGTAIIAWSVDEAALYVAREASGDRQQLYEWWLANADAFGPTE